MTNLNRIIFFELWISRARSRISPLEVLPRYVTLQLLHRFCPGRRIREESRDQLDQLVGLKICERSFLKEVGAIRHRCPKDLGEVELGARRNASYHCRSAEILFIRQFNGGLIDYTKRVSLPVRDHEPPSIARMAGGVHLR
jgi:hypothetical protein